MIPKSMLLFCLHDFFLERKMASGVMSECSSLVGIKSLEGVEINMFPPQFKKLDQFVQSIQTTETCRSQQTADFNW